MRSAKVLAVSALLLGVAVAVVYMNSLSGPFIWDDLLCISENEHIKNLWPLSDM